MCSVRRGPRGPRQSERQNKISSALYQYIEAQKKLALTETPIQNYPRDLFALLPWIEHKEYGEDVNRFLVVG